MSKPFKTLDIGAYFGGAKKATTVELGKAPKKSKDEAKPDDASAEVTPKGGKKAGKGASPGPAEADGKAGQPEPKTSAEVEVKPSPKRVDASPAKKRTPQRAAAAAAASTAVDSDDDEDEVLPIGRAAARKATSTAAASAGAVKTSRASAAAFLADESDDEEGDVRVGDVRKRARQVESAPAAPLPAPPVSEAAPVPSTTKSPGRSPARAAKAPAPPLPAVMPSDFFSNAVVQRPATQGAPAPAPKPAPKSAAAAIVIDDDDEEDAVMTVAQARAAAAALKPSIAIAPMPQPRAAATAASSASNAIRIDDDDDDDSDDFNLLTAPARPKQSKPAAPAPAPAAAKRPRMEITAPTPAPAPAPAPPKPKPAPAAAPVQPLIGGLMPPRGAPDCLKDKKFCITGELTTMTRDQAIGIIKTHGGECVTGMSGLVTHLLIGDKLEDGRSVEEGSKYQKAQELIAAAESGDAKPTKKKRPVVQIIREDAFVDMLEATLPPGERPDRSMLRAGGAALPVAAASAGSSSAAAASAAATSSSSAAPGPAPERENGLWVEKYRPRTFDEFVGNMKELNALDEWLRAWHGKHSGEVDEKEKVKGVQARAALLSGPPGIGKTTAAVLLGRRYGYVVQEMNASDARSKKILQEMLTGVTDNAVLKFGSVAGAATATGAPVRKLIIMDEVDGMSSGDRGGNAELIKIIKKSRTPIICICNDRQKQTVKSLANSCYDIKFSAPTTESIVRRCQQIARAEDMTVEDSALAALVESCGRDLRSSVNALQMWRTTSKSISKAAMDARLKSVNKDEFLRLDAFTATPRLFMERGAPLEMRSDLFFVDYDLIPLLVQGNYISACDRGTGSDMAKMLRASRAADCICDADIMSDYIRGRQAWGLLPAMSMAIVRAATYPGGAAPGFMQFPQYLAKNSSRNKRARLLAEMGLRLSPHISAGRESIRTDYFPVLRDAIFAPLTATSAADDPPRAVKNSLAIVDAYGLSREDVMETMMTDVVFETEPPLAKGVNTQVKSAFTREYNRGGHRVQSSVSVGAGMVAAMRGGKRSTAALKISEMGEEVDDDDDDEEEDAGDGDGEDGDATPAAPSKSARGRGRGRGGSTGGRASSAGKATGKAKASKDTAARGRGRGRGRGSASAAAAPSVKAGVKRGRAEEEDDDDYDDDDDEVDLVSSEDDD